MSIPKETSGFIRAVGMYKPATLTVILRLIGGYTKHTIMNHNYKGKKIIPHDSHFSYPALTANGYTMTQKRPQVMYTKGDAEIVLGADYMPETVFVGGVQVDIPIPCWTIGDMEDCIKRVQKP